ncbi:SRPBCC domain-containing protein [Streptomyces roseifaciens]
MTDAEATAAYWGHSNVSDWQAGSSWEHVRIDGSGVADVVGTVAESDPPKRLVTTWAGPDEERPDGPSKVTFDIKALGEVGPRLSLGPRHQGRGSPDAESGRGGTRQRPVR